MGSISVRYEPTGILFDPHNGYIYVANKETISVIDPAKNSVVVNVKVGGRPASLAFDPANNLIYIARNRDPSVIAISDATNSVEGSFRVGYSTGVAFDPSNGFLYITRTVGKVVVWNPTTSQLVKEINNRGIPLGILYDPQNQLIYVSGIRGRLDTKGFVDVIDGTTNSYVDEINLGCKAFPLALDTPTQELIAPCTDVGVVHILSTYLTPPMATSLLRPRTTQL